MMYAFIEDGRISEISCGSMVPEGAVMLPADFCGVVGQRVEEFNEDWSIRPLSNRVKDGLVNLPPGYKLAGENFVPMSADELVKTGQLRLKPTEVLEGAGDKAYVREKTFIELMRDGLAEVPKGYRLVKSPEAFEGLALEPMTPNEMVKAGQMTRETAAEIYATEGRAVRSSLFQIHDDMIAKLNRRLRLANIVGEDTTALIAELQQWDAYAESLCDIPDQPGFLRGEIAWPSRPDGIQS
jgi:hypothetical protein